MEGGGRKVPHIVRCDNEGWKDKKEGKSACLRVSRVDKGQDLGLLSRLSERSRNSQLIIILYYHLPPFITRNTMLQRLSIKVSLRNPMGIATYSDKDI